MTQPAHTILPAKQRDRVTAGLLVLVVSLVMVMGYFGLRPKGYRPQNGAHWLPAEAGLSFDGHGIAFTERFELKRLLDNEFSVVMALKPDVDEDSSFRFIVVAHDGSDSRQLVIGQWRNLIIALNGDDYNALRKTRRITAAISGSDGAQLVILTTGTNGTRLYVNGELKRYHAQMRLHWPGGADYAGAGGTDTVGARLVVGNSVYGSHPWSGELTGLAVFARPLQEAAVAELYASWIKTGSFAAFGTPISDSETRLATQSPEILYSFSEVAGNIAYDSSGNGLDLRIPPRMRILQKKVLAPPTRLWKNTEDWSLLVVDVALNFFGFIPLGFAMAMLLRRIKKTRHHYWIGACAFCIALSLVFELTQVWIPTRSSDLLDLILNSMGGAAGASGVTLRGRYIEGTPLTF